MKSNNLWGRIVAVAALLLLVAGGTAFARCRPATFTAPSPTTKALLRCLGSP